MMTARPASTCSANLEAFSRSTTLTDLDVVDQAYHPMPSPQAWLVSSKRRTVPSFLDPPGSPLELLYPVTSSLDDGQWNQRFSLLTHRYLHEDGIDNKDEVVNKAWEILNLFCAGERARRSLQKFKATFSNLSKQSRSLQAQSLVLERSPARFKFLNFIDDSFNLSQTNLSLRSLPSSMDTLTDGARVGESYQSQKQDVGARELAPSSLGPRNEPVSNDAQDGRVKPGSPTPTAASEPQVSTPDFYLPPPPSTASTGKRNAWMVSAARRVGIVSSTPRSKKEGRIYKRISPRKGGPKKTMHGSPYQHANKTLSACYEPPNNKEPIQGTIKSPPTLAADTVDRVTLHQSSPPEKPLPSLPIATIETGSPIVRRSLIDASEKPLGRPNSPTSSLRREEQWPILFPSRPATPCTIQGMVRDGSLNRASFSLRKVSDDRLDLPNSGHQRALHDLNDKISSSTSKPNPMSSKASLQSTSRPSSSVEVTADVENKGDISGITHKFQRASKGGDSERDPTAAKRLNLHVGPEDGAHEQSTFQQTLPGGADPFFATPIHADDIVSPAQHTSLFPQEISKVRPSRLPKRSSVTGPIRRSSGPNMSSRCMGSSYISVSAPISGAITSQKHPSVSNVQRRDSPQTPLQASCAAGAADTLFHDGSKLPSAKRPSDLRGRGPSRSSIPRPRHQLQTSQGPTIEREVIESRLPKLKPYGCISTRFPDLGDGDSGAIAEHGSDVNFSGILDNCPGSRHAVGPLGGRMTSTKMNAEADTLSGVLHSESQDQNCLSSLKDDAPTGPGECAESPILAAKSTSIVNPYFDTARQIQVIDKPLNRVKRLSTAAPDHGPVLRISDFAEKVIMGEKSVLKCSKEPLKIRARNTVPDLRQSVIVKELPKSKESLLHGVSPLSRSLTTRSLSVMDVQDEGDNTTSWKDPESLNLEPCDPDQSGNDRCSQVASEGHDAKTPVETNVVPDDPSPGPSAESHRPLEPSQEATSRLSSQKDDCHRSWIFPLQETSGQQTAVRDPTAPITVDQGGSFEPMGLTQPASERVRPQCGPNSSSSDFNTCIAGRKMSPLSGNPAGTARTRFPPRTSSKPVSPDISAMARAQFNHGISSNIPNRFETGWQPKVLRESSPAVMSIGPETLRNSMYEPKATAGSTPTNQNMSKAHRSGAKSMLSNFKGLFQKRAKDGVNANSTTNCRPPAPPECPAVVGTSGGTHSNFHTPTPLTRHRSTMNTYDGRHPATRPRDGLSPLSGYDVDHFCHATNLAIRVLDAARVEFDETKRCRLLQLGESMVEVVTGARDAEKAMEEAKQAATKAESHFLKAKKTVMELTRSVENGLR